MGVSVVRWVTCARGWGCMGCTEGWGHGPVVKLMSSRPMVGPGSTRGDGGVGGGMVARARGRGRCRRLRVW